jgi:hypothetical protein
MTLAALEKISPINCTCCPLNGTFFHHVHFSSPRSRWLRGHICIERVVNVRHGRNGLLEDSEDYIAIAIRMGFEVEGEALLWWAAGKGYKAVVQLLLEKGADVDAKDEYEPLFW